MAEILYPSGYGTTELPIDELMDRHLPVWCTEPEFRRRMRVLLIARGGQLGLGDVLPRSSNNAVSIVSLLNLSFHQLKKFSDGTVWAAANDTVVRRRGTTHSSGAVPTGLVPVQGSAEAKKFGIHANVGTPGKRGFESWHAQAIEHDGHYSFTRLGRPRPVPGYPLPVIAGNPQHVAPPSRPPSTVTPSEGILVNNQAVNMPTLRKGSKGRHVHLWQRIIGAHPDGDFGPQTDELTRVAQAMLEVKVDGIVGTQTWVAALK